MCPLVVLVAVLILFLFVSLHFLPLTTRGRSHVPEACDIFFSFQFFFYFWFEVKIFSNLLLLSLPLLTQISSVATDLVEHLKSHLLHLPSQQVSLIRTTMTSWLLTSSKLLVSRRNEIVNSTVNRRTLVEWTSESFARLIYLLCPDLPHLDLYLLLPILCIHFLIGSSLSFFRLSFPNYVSNDVALRIEAYDVILSFHFSLFASLLSPKSIPTNQQSTRISKTPNYNHHLFHRLLSRVVTSFSSLLLVQSNHSTHRFGWATSGESAEVSKKSTFAYVLSSHVCWSPIW